MAKYFDMLLEDVRLREGLTACMNCGVCTAVCPAAAFYNYDPRQIVSIVQTRDDEAIESLLKSNVIWYCGECMSCRPRCPRGNTPAYVIQALRTLSQKLCMTAKPRPARSSSGAVVNSGCIACATSAMPQPLSRILTVTQPFSAILPLM